MAESASGKDEANPAFCLDTRRRPILPSLDPPRVAVPVLLCLLSKGFLNVRLQVFSPLSPISPVIVSHAALRNSEKGILSHSDEISEVALFLPFVN